MSAAPASGRMSAALQGLVLDHLVVGAADLDQGLAWCEQTLGVMPAPGGRHALMGTHNRLLSIGAAGWPRSYLEIIAIDPAAAPPGRSRWFDLDRPALQQRLRAGPGLIHWVARCADLDATLARWRGLGLEPGPALAASRATPAGELRWRIAVRDDGARLDGGALPLLIEWGDMHPADSLPASGLRLLGFGQGRHRLRAELATPRGTVELEQIA